MHHGAAGLGFRLEQGSGLSEGLLAVVLVLLSMAASQRTREGRRTLGVLAPALLACHVGGDQQTREMPRRQLAPPVLIRPRCRGWSV